MSGRACDVGVCVWGEAMKACVGCGGMNGRASKAQCHVDLKANWMMKTFIVECTHVRM